MLRVNLEPDIVEDKEFGFRPDKDCVADAAGLDVGFRLLRRRTRVSRVRLAGRGFNDRAEQDQLRLGCKRIHNRSGQIGHQDHVGFINGLPTGDRRSIEHDAVLEHVFVDGGDMLCCVLPLAAGVGEPKIDELYVVFLDHF